MPTDKRIFELVEYGITDEQITGACDMAKESISTPNLGYVLAILRSERERKSPRKDGSPVSEAKANQTQAETIATKEEWQRQGFASQADYDACDHAYTMAKLKNYRLTWVDFRRNWIAEAV